MAKRGDYGFAVFNRKYQNQFAKAGIPFVFEGRNKGAGHLVVKREHVISTIKSLAKFDHSVLALNRNPHEGDGFTTEYVLQCQILTHWDQTPSGQAYRVIQDEYPVDGGLTSRRIDILAQNMTTGDWLIIELKRAEASIAAVYQISDYLLALGRQDKFSFGRLKGVLIAERIPVAVKQAADLERIEVYEASWPHVFCQI